MKRFWNSAVIAGLSVLLLALCAPGARAQSTSPTLFGGTINLPFQVAWGPMVLPAGEYTLHYGAVNGTTYVVEVEGKAKGSPHGLVLARNPNATQAMTSSLVCVRAGDSGIVRELEMPEIGRSISFPMPKGARLMASNRKGHAGRAVAQLKIQRIPVLLNAK
jgi:hypothetical protein